MWNRTPVESQKPPLPPNNIHGKGPDARQLQPQFASGPCTVDRHLRTSPGHQGGSQAERSASVHCSAESQSQGNRPLMPRVIFSATSIPGTGSSASGISQKLRKATNQVDRNFFSPIKMLARESGREHQGLCAHMLHKQGVQLVHSRP